MAPTKALAPATGCTVNEGQKTEQLGTSLSPKVTPNNDGFQFTPIIPVQAPMRPGLVITQQNMIGADSLPRAAS
jgi:hypothetical protein